MGERIRSGPSRPRSGALRPAWRDIFSCRWRRRAPDFEPVRRGSHPIWSRTGCIRPRSPSSRPSSSTPTGNSCGRTTASAITAARIIRNCCARFRRTRRSPGSRAPTAIRDHGPLGALGVGRAAEPLPHVRRTGRCASRACRCCDEARQLHHVGRGGGAPAVVGCDGRTEHRHAAAVPLSDRPGITCSATMHCRSACCPSGPWRPS